MKSTQRRLLITVIVFAGLVTFYIARQPEEMKTPPPVVDVPMPTPEAPVPEPAQIKAAPLKLGARSYYGSLPEGVKDISSLPLANRPTSKWLPQLKDHLRKQGGSRLVDLSVTPEESYVISDGGAGRFVERVTVKLKGKDGAYTSFFAEVDSETGYVLKTWGAAIQEKPRHRH